MKRKNDNLIIQISNSRFSHCYRIDRRKYKKLKRTNRIYLLPDYKLGYVIEQTSLADCYVIIGGDEEVVKYSKFKLYYFSKKDITHRLFILTDEQNDIHYSSSLVGMFIILKNKSDAIKLKLLL